MTTVLQLHEGEGEREEEGEGEGDILVFLTGREEIEAMQSLLLRCCKLFPAGWLEMCVCPLFASLPSKHQQLVFDKTPKV